MQVAPISKPSQTHFHPITSSSFKPVTYQSSLEGIGEFARKEKGSIFSKLYRFLRRTVRTVWGWLISCIPQPSKAEKGKEVDYFRVLGTEGPNVRYRLMVNGKGTDNEIIFSQTTSDLQGISFPNKADRAKIPEMIRLLMDKEKIDSLRTSNLQRAKLLWDSGLKTGSFITFKLEGQDPLNKLLRQVIQKALSTRDFLNEKAKQVLLRIEENIIRCIIAEAIQFDNFADSTTFSTSFNPALARAEIAHAQKILGYAFDLEALASRAEEKRDPEDQMYVDAIKEVAALKTVPNVLKTDPQIELEFQVGDLFTLLDATDISMDPSLIQGVPNMVFSKKET